MGLRVEEKTWQWLRSTGTATIRESLEHGRRLLATLRADWAFGIVSVPDLRALSALADLRPSALARLLARAKSQEERKAIVRLLDWMAAEGIVDEGEE